jgi:methylaspartate ammonia-lyase
MQITDVLLAKGDGAFFYDDQAAIVAGAPADGFAYEGVPRTAGFSSIREPAEALSIGLQLTDGAVVWGDMMSVQYAGAAGREPRFKRAAIAEIIRAALVPRLIGRPATDFLPACAAALAPYGEMRLPLAIEYGVSQALLRAAARVHRCAMAEVVCREFHLPIPFARVPIFAQSGDARETNVDKMILKSAEILPHGLFNSGDKFGKDGAAFRQFVQWVVKRIAKLGSPAYSPSLHFDVYGWIGRVVGLDAGRIAEFIARVGDDAPGFTLHIECPADFGSVEAQLDGYGGIVAALRRIGSAAKIVVDEHCNTLRDIELFASARAAHLVQIKMPDVGSIADAARAVLACKRNGVGAYVGGSCSETDLSARASVHIAVATQADMILAKPGMGVDEALCIVGNEQNRLLAELRHRHGVNISDRSRDIRVAL